MIANDLRRLVENAPVFVNGVPYVESKCLGHEVTALYCVDGNAYIRTDEYMGENSHASAISVGQVEDVLLLTSDTCKLTFEFRGNKKLAKEISATLLEILEMTSVYRSFAVQSLSVDDDTLIIEVMGEINVQ